MGVGGEEGRGQVGEVVIDRVQTPHNVIPAATATRTPHHHHHDSHYSRSLPKLVTHIHIKVIIST